MRVPQLAIHLDRAIGQEGLKLDRQQHMAPITAVGERREGAFRDLVAAEIGCAPTAIKSWDAMLHDLTPSRLIGVDEDMLAAPRLDNLCSAYLGLEAVIAAADAGAQRGVAVTLFDHEEVGSGSRGGADGPERARRLPRALRLRAAGRSPGGALRGDPRAGPASRVARLLGLPGAGARGPRGGRTTSLGARRPAGSLASR